MINCRSFPIEPIISKRSYWIQETSAISDKTVSHCKGWFSFQNQVMLFRKRCSELHWVLVTGHEKHHTRQGPGAVNYAIHVPFC